ncbi:MAG TPA: hypothetical protein VII59_17820 [Streptosporangiaceae bacterium]
MAETIEALERRIDELRVAVREAVLAGDRTLAGQRRSALRSAEQAWEDALDEVAPAGAAGAGPSAQAGPAEPPESSALPGSLLPLREQVYEALSLLQVPAAPKLIATVHEAFFGATFPTTRVTSLKRDEERSFRTAPFARPYYICAALSADYLAPSRGLLAVSTWPLELRMIGSLSPRADFLTAAIRVAEAIERIPEPPAAARRLLQRFAASVSGAISPGGGADPAAVSEAARAELTVHRDADAEARAAAAERARGLHHAERLFGTTMFRDRAGDAADDAAEAAGAEAKAAGE